MQKLKIIIANNMNSNISNSSILCHLTSFTAKKSRKGKQPVPHGPCGKLFEKDPSKRAGKQSNRWQGIFFEGN